MKSKKTFIVVYTTFPNAKTAKKIINGLLQRRIAVCGNIFRVSSMYVWKDKIEQSPEYGAFIKTVKNNYKKVEHHIKQNHPYEVPEIISWTIERGHKAYLDWIGAEIRKIE